MSRPRRKPRRDPAAELQRLRKLLEDLPSTHPSTRDDIRREVQLLAQVLEALRALARSRLAAITDALGARDRILAYLRMFPGAVIDGSELQIVGGIQEFARRIRELRVQFGYNISTGYSRRDLKPDQYILESSDPDGEAAEKWQVANTIRREGGSARDRILHLLQAFVGKPVTGEQIAYVAKVREDGRRVRELRREYGTRVVTRHTGRPDLPAGVYVLESLDQLPKHDRRIPDAIYDSVLERDMYRCRKCGWSLEYRSRPGRRQFLEVHHVEHHQHGGENNSDNLVTLCNVHHDEIHKRGLTGKAFLEWLPS